MSEDTQTIKRRMVSDLFKWGKSMNEIALFLAIDYDEVEEILRQALKEISADEELVSDDVLTNVTWAAGKWKKVGDE